MLMSNPPFSTGADQPPYHHAHHHPHAHMHAYNPYPRPPIVKRETLDSHYGPLAQVYHEALPYDANGMIAAGNIPPQSASPASSSSSSSLVLLAPYGSTRESHNADARATRDAHHKLLALPEDEEEPEMSAMDQFSAEYAAAGGWPPRKDDGTIKRRSSKACDQCRKSKCKCERSSTSEACKNCVLLHLPCTSLGPSRKRGPPKGYIDAMEARLHQAEAIIGAFMMSGDARAKSVLADIAQDQLASVVLTRIDDSAYGASGRARGLAMPSKRASTRAEDDGDEQPTPLGQIHPTQQWQDNLMTLMHADSVGRSEPRRGSSRADASADDTTPQSELSTDAAWTTASPTAESRYFGPSSGLTLLDAQSHAFVDFHEPQFPSVAPQSIPLPSPLEVQTIVDGYCAYVHSVLPVMDEGVLVALTSVSPQNAVPQELFFAILACGVAHVPATAQGLPCAETYTAHALSLLHPTRASTHSVQTLILLAYITLASSPSRAWILSTQATHFATDLGLHRARPSASLEQHEARSRIWGACIIIDAVTAAAAGRSPSISAKSFDAALPDLDITSGAASDSAMVFAASVSLATVLSRTLTTCYSVRPGVGSAVAELEGSLENWRAALPSHMRPLSPGSGMGDDRPHAKEVEGMWAMYWTTVDLISRPCASGTPRATNRGWKAAQGISNIVEGRTGDTTRNWVPYAVFRAGLIWRDAAHLDNTEAHHELGVVVNFLRTIARTHPVAGRYAELLSSPSATLPLRLPSMAVPSLPAAGPSFHPLNTPSSPTTSSSSAPFFYGPPTSTVASAPTPLRLSIPELRTTSNDRRKQSITNNAGVALSLARRRGVNTPNYMGGSASAPSSSHGVRLDCSLSSGYSAPVESYGLWDGDSYSQDAAPGYPSQPASAVDAPYYWNNYTSPQSALAMNYGGEAMSASSYEPYQPGEAATIRQQRAHTDANQAAFYQDFHSSFGV